MNSLVFSRQITVVWALTIVLTGLLAGLWYILQPVLIYVTILFNNSMADANLNSTNTNNVVALLKLSGNVFIPIMILGLWLWAFISSQRREWVGYEYEA